MVVRESKRPRCNVLLLETNTDTHTLEGSDGQLQIMPL